MPISKRYEILSWAAGSDNRFVIEDEYDSELRLNGKPIPTMYSIDVMNKVIYMNTFTKTLSSTIRISYMVLPEVLLKKYYEKLFFYACTVSNFEQYTLAHFINEGYFEKHLNRVRNYYRKKRENLISSIKNSSFSKKIEIKEEDAGLHFILKVRSKKSEEKIIEEAKEKKILIRPLSYFYRDKDKAPDKEFLINYSSASEEELEKAVLILGEIL